MTFTRAVRKEYRDLTVGDIYRNGKSVPMLRVSGLWLEELGFKTGDFVRIKCEDGQLIISLNEEKAQQVAAEKAFMEEEVKKLQKRYQKEKEQIHARFVAEGKVGTVHEEGHFEEGGNHGKDLYDSLYEGWVCQDSHYIQFGLFITETWQEGVGG